MLIFMQLKTQLYIDGKWVNGSSTLAVIDPSDESVIANVQVSSDKECKIMLIENKTTTHTGDVKSEITKSIADQK